MNETVAPPTLREVRPAAPPEPSVAPLPPPGPRKRRRSLRFGLAIILAAGAILAWERWERIAPGTVDANKPPEKSGPPAQTIRAANAESGDMPITIDALGTVTPLATGLIFRGLARSFGVMVAAVASAAIFAIVHPPVSVAPVFVLGLLTAAAYERSDVCVIPAAGVVGEAMVAIVLADAMRFKFGGDSLEEALTNFRSFKEHAG